MRRPNTSLAALALCLPAALCIAAAQHAGAQSYPSRPVKMIVPFGAGGPADVYARVLAQRLQAALGQPFVVEDRAGGGSVVGTDFAAKSPADGYTLLVMSNTHTVNETLFEKKPYELMRDFVPVAPINYSDLMLVVHPSLPAKSLQELIALAKSKPGELNYASSGPGTPYHMAGELFKTMAGVNMVHVPHKDSGGARASVMGGQVQAMFDAITTMVPLARAGKVRAIATSGLKRSPVTPDLPTLAEAGVPGYDAVIWLGIMAPTGTPRAVIERINTEITRSVNDAELRAGWEKQGAVPMSMAPDEFGRFLREDIAKWARVVKLSGAKVD